MSCGCGNYEDDCIGKMCTLGFQHYRHLSILRVCDRWRSPTSASLLLLFWCDGVKALDASAIEDNSATKMPINGTVFSRILSSLLDKSGLIRCTSSHVPFFQKGNWKFAYNINAPTLNTVVVLAIINGSTVTPLWYLYYLLMCLSWLHNS